LYARQLEKAGFELVQAEPPTETYPFGTYYWQPKKAAAIAAPEGAAKPSGLVEVAPPRPPEEPRPAMRGLTAPARRLSHALGDVRKMADPPAPERSDLPPDHQSQALAAFDKLDAKGDNFVKLADLRAALPDLTRAEQDAAFQGLRKGGKVWLKSGEYGKDPAGIEEDGETLAHMSRRKDAPGAPPPKPRAAPKSESLANVVRRYGGIAPDSEFKKYFSDADEAAQNGIPLSAISARGKGIDVLARELHEAGFLADADPQTLLDALGRRRKAEPDDQKAAEHALEADARRRADEAAGARDEFLAADPAEMLAAKMDEAKLTKQQRAVVAAIVGGEKAQADIAQQMGISRARVGQLKAAIEKKLGIGNIEAILKESRGEAREDLAGRLRGLVEPAEVMGAFDPETGKKMPNVKLPKKGAEAELRALKEEYDRVEEKYLDAAEREAPEADALMKQLVDLTRRGKKIQQAAKIKGAGTVFANPLPQMAALAGRAAKWMFDWRRGVGRVPLDFDLAHPFPRYAPNFKAAFTVPEGLAKFPGLARLFGPAGTAFRPDERVLLAHQMKRQIADNIGGWFAKINERVRGMVEYDQETGTMKLANGKRGHMTDFFEAELRKPGSQPLSKEITDWLHGEYQPFMNDLRQMLRDKGLDHYLDDQGNRVEFGPFYFPKPAVGKKGVKGSSSASPTGGRYYKTEKEGADAGIIYDPDILARLAKVVSGAYRAVAAHDLANDPDLGGSKAAPVFLVTRHANVPHRSFRGLSFPVETAEAIERHLKAVEARPWEKGVSAVNDFAKALSLGHDASVLTVQMLASSLSGTYKGRPVGQVAWARGFGNFLRSAYDKDHMGRWLQRPENKDAVKELVQAGSSVGRLTDFVQGMGEGELATKIPVVGRGVEWSGRTFGAAVDTLKVEWWKAVRDGVPKDERLAVIQRIDSIAGSGRMEMAGVTPLRALGERLLSLAPSLYRGGLDMITGMADRGVSGKLARRATIGQMAMLTGIGYLGMKYVGGLDDDEIAERMDPRGGKFLAVPVTLSDGSVVNVRLGNIVLSYVRLLGDLVETQTDSKEPGVGPVDVLLRWARTHGSPAVRAGADLATKENYRGEPQSRPETLARAVTPIAAADALYDERGAFGSKGMRQSDAAKAAVGLLGMQAFPEGDSEAKRRALDKEAKSRHGRKFGELSFRDRAKVVGAVEAAAPPGDRPDPSVIERAEAARAERAAELYGMLSGGAKSALAGAGFGAKNLPGYDTSFDVDRQRVPLSSAERKKYAGYVAAEYNAALEGLPDLSVFGPQKREEKVRKALDRAREKAREKVKAEAG
jgi:DNA-binding CsgD family transcriptional regulator